MSRLRPCGLATPVYLFSLLAACSDDQTASTSASTTTGTTIETSTTTDTPTSGASTSSFTSTDTSSSSSSTSTTGEPALEIARGIRLTRVTATQGVQTELVRDGVEVPAQEYAVPLISRRKTVLRADWLLAPHHGSRSSSSWRFLQAVRPSGVLISRGRNNAFGHPHAQVVERYRRLGAQIHDTAEQGAVRVRLGEFGQALGLREQPRFWRRNENGDVR